MLSHQPLVGQFPNAKRVNFRPRSLSWDRVDQRAGFVRLRPEDTKEDDSRVIPISPAFTAILWELRQEQHKVPNIAASVFTREGRTIRSIRTAFERAKKAAGIQDVVIHDFRHTAITKWILRGIPQEVVMKASGHKSLAMHYRYVNLGEQQIKQAFQQFPQRAHTAAHLDEASGVSY